MTTSENKVMNVDNGLRSLLRHRYFSPRLSLQMVPFIPQCGQTRTSTKETRYDCERGR